MEYQYPIDVDWSQDEMLAVINFFNKVEDYYERKVEGSALKNAYSDFKKVVPGKADEKNIFAEFEKSSGYNSYKVVKLVKDNPDEKYFSVNAE